MNMTFTEQQLQAIASYNVRIGKLLQEVYNKKIEDGYVRRKEELMKQVQTPSEEETHKAIKELAHHDLTMRPLEHVSRDRQPFYLKFLNKRNKKNKRK